MPVKKRKKKVCDRYRIVTTVVLLDRDWLWPNDLCYEEKVGVQRVHG